MDKKEGKGLKILLICGIIAMILIILCVFFPEQIFGLFGK
jgi:Na+-driven multidrug efflux pump